MQDTAPRPTEQHTLHFDLSHVSQADELTLHACLQRYPIQPHTDESRVRARQTHPFLHHVPDEHVTHYAEVPLPSDAVALLWVTRPVTVGDDTAEHLVTMSFHIPREGHRRVREAARTNGGAPWEVHPKLARFAGLAKSPGAADVDPDFPDHIEDYKDAVEASAALLFHHPNLINLNTSNGGEIPAYIVQNCILEAINRTGDLPMTIMGEGDDWMRTVPAVGPDDKPLIDPKTGKQVYTREISEDVQLAMQGPLALALTLSQDADFLKGQQWTVQQGVTTDTYDGRSHSEGPTPLEHRPLGVAVVRRALEGGVSRWALSNLTPGSGLTVDASVKYTPPPGSGTWAATGSWADATSIPSDDGKKLDQAGSLTPEIVQKLLAGDVFVKIATKDHPDGLIRGQLVASGPVADGQPVTFTATLDGQQMVPAVDTQVRGSATFTLNGIRTALSYDLTATGLGAGAVGAFGVGAKGQAGSDVTSFPVSDQRGYGTLEVSCKNHWLRHLVAYVQFFDQVGNPIEPKDWNEQLPGFLQGMLQPNKTKKFVGVVSPVQTVFGVPLPPDPTVLKVAVPEEAHTVVFLWGGLGIGPYDVDVCPFGITLTVVVEMAMPIILAIAGAAIMNTKVVQDLLADKDTLYAIAAIGGFLGAAGAATYIAASQDPGHAVKQLAIKLAPQLLSPTLALGKFILEKISESAAEKAVPFFNVATTVVKATVTVAQLTQTIVEVLQSPFVFRSEVTRSIDLKVTLTPDHRYHQFPTQAATYMVSVVYDKSVTNPQQTWVLQGSPPWSDPIVVNFSGVPAGGRLKVYVFFYANNGWQAGQGESAWWDAEGTDGDTLVIPNLEITTNQVPLTKGTVYVHRSKIAYDEGQGGHHWLEAPNQPPTATRRTASPHPGHEVNKLVGITVAQSPAQMGYAWQATGLHLPLDRSTGAPVDSSMFTLQNLSILQHPEEKFAMPKVGFSLQSGIFYDVASSDDGGGANFFIDPTMGTFDPDKNPGGGLHVRRVALAYKGAAPDFSVATDKSWGRFPMPLDQYVLHPQGYVLGISYEFHKLFILSLPSAPSKDKDAPMAHMAAGEGFREGLMKGPRGLATGLDGRILILESINQRIQAFDVAGNPVPYFADPDHQGQKSSTMALEDPGNSFYLDLSVEAKGYLFVLRYTGDGAQPSDYRVDVYEPDGTFLVATTNVTAAKIAVSLLRDLYTLNYEVILGPGSRTEPSVSLWSPPAPPS